MRERAGSSTVQIVGREAELDALAAFAEESGRALVLSGGPGIGKTTLWEAGIAAARERGMRVLMARASGAEAQLSFAGLIDLLDVVSDEELAGLPAPQRRALEVALLRAEPGRAAPDSGAIAMGFLNAVRAFASPEPLLIAVDDVQWLDSPSTDALAFAARRLETDAASFLLARRPGRLSAFERSLEPGSLRLEVAPLSMGAIQRMLSERLGLNLPRHLLRQLVDLTLGNPLFALEVGRTFVDQGPAELGEGLPVPDTVEDMLGTRMTRLPAPVRRLLLAVALTGELQIDQLSKLAGVEAVDATLEAGAVVLDGQRVRASHPLLAAAARKHSRARVRRELHRELATIVADQELRARHLALAAERPDEELAAIVADAAAAAFARGARHDAVELGEHALRLTSPSSRQRSERLLALGEYLVLADEKQRVTDLIAPEIESVPRGAPRAHAWLLLVGGAIKSYDEIDRNFARALEESRGDPGLHAAVLVRRAEYTACIRVARIADAETSALEALRARIGDPEAERLALYMLGWARSLRGRPIDDVCERFLAVTDAAISIGYSPERVAGQRLVWRGELDGARAALARLLQLADDQGEPYAYALMRLHVFQLELRIGDCEAAGRLLDEWEGDREIFAWPMYERCRALLAAGRGLADEAVSWAEETLNRADETGNRWDRLEALRAQGLAALLAHDPTWASDRLRHVWEHKEREGVEEPGVFPVAPELVEALVESGELDEARAVTDRLIELAEQQEHPWGLPTARRCDALVRLGARIDEDAAAVDLEEAAGAYADLGLRFDRARTLLLLGRAQRRRKKWAAARGALEQAASAFEELGSPGWAGEARSELARVGARRPTPTGRLTPTEERVVALAVEGLSNKEIASKLVVTVNTVETHLSHAYAKLGVHSRGQLARALSSQP